MRRQYGLTRAAPRPADDGAGEDATELALEEQITRLELFIGDVLPQDARQGRVPRHRARLALSAALQVTLLVDLTRVGPLLPDLRRRRVDQQLAPLVVGVGFRQGHVFHPHGYGFLGPGAAVVQRGEEGVEPLAAPRPAPDPVEDGRRLLGIQQGPLVHGVRGFRDRRRLLALGKRVGPKDAPPDRVLHGDVEDPAVALPGPGRRLLAIEAGVDGVQDLVDLLRVLPGRDRQGIPLDPFQDGHHVSRGVRTSVGVERPFAKGRPHGRRRELRGLCPQQGDGGGGQGLRDVLAAVAAELRPTGVHVLDGELVPAHGSRLGAMGHRETRGDDEGLALARGPDEFRAEALGERDGVEGLTPALARDYPAHGVRGLPSALVGEDLVDLHVVRRLHQAASSRSSSQWSRSLRRIRRSPFGSLMQRGARRLARQS